MAAKQHQQNAHETYNHCKTEFRTNQQIQSFWIDNKPLNQLHPESQPKNEYIAHPVRHTIMSILSSTALPPQPPKRPISMNRVIVFDFNDTLFPSSKFSEISARSNGPFALNLTAKERLEFTQLSYYTAYMLLAYIHQYSKRNICIVTSSSPGWIEQVLSQISGIGCYSAIYKLIFDPNDKEKDKISIYYGQGLQAPSPQIVIRNKYQAFLRILNEKTRISEHYSMINRFIIIGDSLYEHVAAKQLRQKIESMVSKNNENTFIVDRIKLEYNPSIGSLAEEHHVLQQFCDNDHYQYNSIVNHGYDLDYLKEKNNKLSIFFENQ